MNPGSSGEQEKGKGGARKKAKVRKVINEEGIEIEKRSRYHPNPRKRKRNRLAKVIIF